MSQFLLISLNITFIRTIRIVIILKSLYFYTIINFIKRWHSSPAKRVVQINTGM